MIGTLPEVTATLNGSSRHVIVVGSGPVGLAVRRVLRARGIPVLVLESGPAEATRSDPSNDADVVAHDYTGAARRPRGLGGGSGFWAGQSMRFHARDLAPRDWVTHSGWPVEYDDLLHDYADAERWLGVSANLYHPAAWETFGLRPLPSAPSDLDTRMSVFAPRAPLFEIERKSLAADRGTLIASSATVVELTREQDRVTGVVAVDKGGRRYEIPGRAVVLCAGSIETARLLLVPTRDFPSGPGGGNPHVGAGLQDHPNGVVASVTADAAQRAQLATRYSVFHTRRSRLLPKLVPSAAWQERERTLNSCLVPVYEWAEDSVTYELRQIQQAVAGRRFDLSLSRRIAGAVGRPQDLVRLARSRARGRTSSETPAAVKLHVFLEQPPYGSSRVTLSSRSDALGRPVPHVRWDLGDHERETARKTVELAAAHFSARGWGDVAALPELADDDAWVTLLEDNQHQTGTARMASGPAGGVCDTQGAVFGLTGLHVAGGALFPSGSYANPTLTMIALGMRVARHLDA